MLKKTLLSAAVASSFALSGCLDDSPSTTENAGSVTNPPVANGVFPIFSPSEAKFPVPNDLLYSSETAGDGTFVDLGVPNPLPPYSASEYNPVTAALGGLSGASTVAPIDIAMSGLIDPASLKGQSDGAEQNVFLIALEYASGSPVQGLSIGEPPQAASSQPTFEIEHKVLDGNSTIRINPTSVLEPLTRYIVVVKNTITDQAGESIIKSPGAAGYEALTDETNPLSGSLAALQPVQALINGLWEPIAIAGIPVIDSDADIALTYSFTTSGDEKVLNYIAEPNLWFNDQITRFVGVSTATAIVTDQTDLNMDGKVDYTDVNLATQGALAAFPINPSDPTDTTVADALAPLQAGFGLLPAPCPGLTPDGTNG
ncbi:Ig-like domain-containing protein, partial [Oleiphilus sp. HI0067]